MLPFDLLLPRVTFPVLCDTLHSVMILDRTFSISMQGCSMLLSLFSVLAWLLSWSMKDLSDLVLCFDCVFGLILDVIKLKPLAPCKYESV